MFSLQLLRVHLAINGRLVLASLSFKATYHLPELLAHNATWEEILKASPFLEADDIRACLEFAASQNDHVILRAP